jgi:hypothetical protein
MALKGESSKRNETCSLSLPHLHTQHAASNQKEIKKKEREREGEMVGLGWIDNILFTHASAHRDPCTYTHILSLSVYNVVLSLQK